MTTVSIALLLVTQLAVGQASSAKNPWERVPLKPVSEIELPADTLDGKWKPSEGFRVDDLSKTEALPAAKRQLAEALAKQLSPVGIRSAADYTLIKTGFPLNTVTVRLYVFEDAKKCRAWWEKKYRADGWRKHYEQVDCENAVVVRSLQTNKTAMAFGNVWLTTHQLRDGDEHLKAANHVLKLLTADKRSLPK